MSTLGGGSRRTSGFYSLERFVPRLNWISKDWRWTEEEILSAGGLDAVVFIAAIVFWWKYWCTTLGLCTIYSHICREIIGGWCFVINESAQNLLPPEVTIFVCRLWAHCLALQIISISARILLYFEYTAISKLKQFHITRSLPNLSQFTVFVCGIPRSTEEPLSDTVRNFFFTRYHGPSYLPYQIIYRVGKSKKLWAVQKKFIGIWCTSTLVLVIRDFDLKFPGVVFVEEHQILSSSFAVNVRVTRKWSLITSTKKKQRAYRDG